MEKRKIFTILILITLIASTFSVFEITSSESSNSDSIPEHEEFTEPTRIEREQYEGLSYLYLHYDYQMTYGLPPENIIARLQGNYN
ncbi:MAG: hypothetical protein ACLFVB_09625 [Thermoplasmata archaeon]